MRRPRPDVVVAEMRRVLKPGGRVVFAAWPPERFPIYPQRTLDPDSGNCDLFAPEGSALQRH